MQMISLWQPFASLIFTLPPLKHFETRSFAFPKRLIGERIAIHATAKFASCDAISNELDDLCKATFGQAYRNTMPCGALIGTVILQYFHKIEKSNWADVDRNDFICGDWTPGRYAWRLCEPHIFPLPIPQKGGQGWRKIEWL